MNAFEEFLLRQRTAIIAAYVTVMKRTTTLESSQIQTATEQAVDIFLNLILAHVKPTDSQALAAARQAHARGISIEEMLQRVQTFIGILQDCCAADSSLDEAKRQHISRMIEQSGRFLSTVVGGAMRQCSENGRS